MLLGNARAAFAAHLSWLLSALNLIVKGKPESDRHAYGVTEPTAASQSDNGPQTQRHTIWAQVEIFHLSR